MQEVDWDLAKFKYEVLGFSFEDLAAELSIPVTIVQFASKDKGWDRSSLVGSSSILEEIKKKNSAANVLKQQFLGPKYIALETTLLSKALELATQLDTQKPQAVTALKTLVQVLKDLIAANPDMQTEDTEPLVQKWEIEFVEPQTTSAKEVGSVHPDPKAV